MRIAIGSDHGGFDYKEILIDHLTSKGYEVVNYGCYSKDSVDYPDVAFEVATEVAQDENTLGILICGTGIGISIAANKVNGIRCALCHDTFSAKATRQHNDSNILAMGQRVIGVGLMLEIVDTWLESAFEGGRHQQRIDKISKFEINE